MSRKEAVLLGSRLLATLLTVWALSELSSLPGSVYSFLHYADGVPVMSGATQYLQHHYLISLGFLIVRIVGFSLVAGWLFHCGPDVEEFLLPTALQEGIEN
jgi:hypothetical protein